MNKGVSMPQYDTTQCYNCGKTNETLKSHPNRVAGYYYCEECYEKEYGDDWYYAEDPTQTQLRNTQKTLLENLIKNLNFNLDNTRILYEKTPDPSAGSTYRTWGTDWFFITNPGYQAQIDKIKKSKRYGTKLLKRIYIAIDDSLTQIYLYQDRPIYQKTYNPADPNSIEQLIQDTHQLLK